jgi:nucleotide-binding universal stress UspA family protein
MMLQFRKMLVPLTSFAPHQRILDQAVELSRKFNSQLLLVHKEHRSSNPEQRFMWMMAEDEDTTRFEPLPKADSGADEERKITHHHLQEGPTASKVVEFGIENRVDLILLETHAHSILGRKIFGGTAEEIARWSPSAILTIRKDEPVETPTGFSNLLIPMDFSDRSVSQLRMGAKLARMFGAKVHCLHVLEQPRAPMLFGKSEPDPANSEEIEIAKSGAQSELERLQKAIKATDIHWQNHIVAGQPIKEILDFARREPIDLIVMNGHGVSNDADFLLGHVAEKVLRRSESSVLLLKK